VVSFMPRPTYPLGKSPGYPSGRKLGGLQSWSGHGGEVKNSQPPPGIEPANPDMHVQINYSSSSLFSLTFLTISMPWRNLPHSENRKAASVSSRPVCIIRFKL